MSTQCHNFNHIYKICSSYDGISIMQLQWYPENTLFQWVPNVAISMISTRYALPMSTQCHNFNDIYQICSSNVGISIMQFQWYPEYILFQWAPNGAISMILTRYALPMSTQWCNFNDTHKICSSNEYLMMHFNDTHKICSNEYPMMQFQWYPQDMLF